MKNVLVIHKGTEQAKAFERFSVEYTNKNNIDVNWIFCGLDDIDNKVENNDIAVVLISPEMILVEKQIKEKLDKLNVKYMVMKAVDFGLKRIEQILVSIKIYLE